MSLEHWKQWVAQERRGQPIKERKSTFEGEELHPRLLEAILAQGRNFIFAPLKTREFLVKAIAEGAHNKRPENISQESWLRNRNILGLYFASPASQVELGKIYGLSRERVRQIILEGIRLMWQNCSVEIQQEFPLDKIPSAKSEANYPQEYKLLVRDGIGNKIVRLLDEGKSIEEIKQSLSCPIKFLNLRLRLLRKLGITTPTATHSALENKELAKNLADPTLKDEEVQNLLNQVKTGFYYVNTSGENPLLTPITKLINKSGFYARRKGIQVLIQVLKGVGLPIGSFESEVKTGPQKGMQVYTFTLSRFVERVRENLEGKSELARFKENSVRQIYGPEIERLPTWSQLVKGGEFESVRNAVPKLGLNYRHYAEIFNSDCPVPVLRYSTKSNHYYPKVQREKIKTYILNKLGIQNS